MLKKSVQAIVLLLLAAGAIACPAMGEIGDIPDKVAQHETRLTDIENRIAQIEIRQKKIEAQFEALQKQTGENVAGMGADMSDLATQIREIRGLLDELKYNLENPQASAGNASSEEVARIVRRLKAIEDLLGASPALTEAPIPAPTAPPAPNAPPVANDSLFFKKAYALYEAGKYDDSRISFEEFITKFPGSDLADNAYFWIGECYYQQNDWANAAKSYNQVIKLYPKGNKVPDAYYKMGLAFSHLNKTEAAIASLQKVLTDYPSSYVAPLAKRKLDAIKNK